jgi:hypothetical protein
MSSNSVNKVQINSYSLSRAWFDFSFEKTEAKAIHTALYMWILELNNRLSWKKQFGLPTQDTMEGLSIGNKKTYLTALKELAEWGFIDIIQESKNQYSACIIEICRVKNATAQHSALTSALQRQSLMPYQKSNGTEYSIDYSNDISTGSSTAPIDKPINNETNKPINYFYLRGLAHNIKISEYLENNCRMTIDMWMMRLFKGMNKTEIYEKLDIEYIGMQFSDENHLRNSFKAVGNKLMPKQMQVDNSKPSYDGVIEEKSGKWIWLNNGWRDTTTFTDHQKRKYGLK